MRKLGSKITQKGLGKNVKKSANELLAELSTKRLQERGDKEEKQLIKEKTKKQVTQKQLLKKLNVKPRTFRSYKRYFASLDNPKIKLTKNDRRPSKQLLEKISKLASTKKIRKTREAGNVFDKAQVENLKGIVSPVIFKRLQKEFKKDKFDGLLIRVNVLYITKEGSFSDWPTFRISKKYNERELRSLRGLNAFVTGGVQKTIRNKDSILGFQILSIVFDVTTTEFLPHDSSTKAPSSTKGKKSQSPFKGGTKLNKKK